MELTVAISCQSQRRRSNENRLGEQLNPDSVLQEYPRPQLVRESYENLNGLWDIAITKTDAKPDAWDGKILVPFSPEAELSGVGKALQPG